MVSARLGPRAQPSVLQNQQHNTGHDEHHADSFTRRCLLTEGVARDFHYLYRDETVVGREQGDIVCTDDPFMSRRHASITFDRTSRRFGLKDLGSSNGTAIRVRGERALKAGDQFRVGRHLFRYDRAVDAPGGRS